MKCCFTSTETVALLGTGAQDVHLDFHTPPELCMVHLHLVSSITSEYGVGMEGVRGGGGGTLTVPQRYTVYLCLRVLKPAIMMWTRKTEKASKKNNGEKKKKKKKKKPQARFSNLYEHYMHVVNDLMSPCCEFWTLDDVHIMCWLFDQLITISTTMYIICVLSYTYITLSIIIQ